MNDSTPNHAGCCRAGTGLARAHARAHRRRQRRRVVAAPSLTDGSVVEQARAAADLRCCASLDARRALLSLATSACCRACHFDWTVWTSTATLPLAFRAGFVRAAWTLRLTCSSRCATSATSGAFSNASIAQPANARFHYGMGTRLYVLARRAVTMYTCAYWKDASRWRRRSATRWTTSAARCSRRPARPSSTSARLGRTAAARVIATARSAPASTQRPSRSPNPAPRSRAGASRTRCRVVECDFREIPGQATSCSIGTLMALAANPAPADVVAKHARARRPQRSSSIHRPRGQPRDRVLHPRARHLPRRL